METRTGSEVGRAFFGGDPLETSASPSQIYFVILFTLLSFFPDNNI